MNQLIFITGNQGKLKEAREILKGVRVVNKDIDLPEIQETDAKEVIRAKLLEARKHHRGEYIIEDTSLYLDCLNGLPGPLIKWFLEKLGKEKLFEITRISKNFGAEAKTIIGYMNKKKEIKYFEGSVKGKISSPKGEGGFGWDQIFMPAGYKKTFGEMLPEEKNKLSMRKKALTKLANYIKRH
jgi:non-canonical purine NTP pyrophosphatase (RdgB/HAM1 family)